MCTDAYCNWSTPSRFKHSRSSDASNIHTIYIYKIRSRFHYTPGSLRCLAIIFIIVIASLTKLGETIISRKTCIHVNHSVWLVRQLHRMIFKMRFLRVVFTCFYFNAVWYARKLSITWNFLTCNCFPNPHVHEINLFSSIYQHTVPPYQYLSCWNINIPSYCPHESIICLDILLDTICTQIYLRLENL